MSLKQDLLWLQRVPRLDFTDTCTTSLWYFSNWSCMYSVILHATFFFFILYYINDTVQHSISEKAIVTNNSHFSFFLSSFFSPMVSICYQCHCNSTCLPSFLFLLCSCGSSVEMYHQLKYDSNLQTKNKIF